LTDYCVSCGDADRQNDEGKYLSFETVSDDAPVIFIQRFVCSTCLEEGS
jgi:hypothetical protein